MLGEHAGRAVWAELEVVDDGVVQAERGRAAGVTSEPAFVRKGSFLDYSQVLAVVAERMTGQRTHIRDHLGRPQSVHGDFTLGGTEPERSRGSRRGRVDDLDKIEPKLAAVPQRASDEIGLGRFDVGVQAHVRKVEDGGDAVGFDGVSGEILRALEI
jgi:hypothetical protein